MKSNGKLSKTHALQINKSHLSRSSQQNFLQLSSAKKASIHSMQSYQTISKRNFAVSNLNLNDKSAITPFE